MKIFNSLILVISVIIILLISLTISAENDLNSYNLSENKFANNDYKIKPKANYFNSEYSSHSNKLSIIDQKGSFNIAEVWQLGRPGIQTSSAAVIDQKGNNNEAHIKQLTGPNNASVKQFGSNNLVKVRQLGRENNLRIFQFGNDEKLKVKQY